MIRLLDNQRDFDNDEPCYKISCPREADEVASMLTDIDPLLSDGSLHQQLKSRNELSQLKMAIGSTTASTGNFISQMRSLHLTMSRQMNQKPMKMCYLMKYTGSHMQEHIILMKSW